MSEIDLKKLFPYLGKKAHNKLLSKNMHVCVTNELFDIIAKYCSKKFVSVTISECMRTLLKDAIEWIKTNNIEIKPIFLQPGSCKKPLGFMVPLELYEEIIRLCGDIKVMSLCLRSIMSIYLPQQQF